MRKELDMNSLIGLNGKNPAKNLIFFIRESDWSHFTSACNDRKRKLCETSKEKIVKLVGSELIFGGCMYLSVSQLQFTVQRW